MYAHPFQLLNHMTDYYEIWYGCNAFAGHRTFNILFSSNNMVKAQICEAGVTSISLTLGQCFPISVAYRTPLLLKILCNPLIKFLYMKPNKIDNVHTLHCGALSLPLFPLNCNSTFLFSVGIAVDVNSIKVFGVAMQIQQCFFSALL
jgi:hypothetical protein